MDRSHHPVLAQVSLSYSEAKGRFPRVTHPCATNPEGFVRLACVRHAASVRSEPGSNSQVCVTKPRHGKNPPTAASNFGSRYLHLSNVMDTKDMSDIGLKNRYPEPEDPRTGRRRPHVPSSKPTMSKSHQITVSVIPKRQNQADNHPPRFLLPGDWVSVYVGDRSFLPF